MKKFFAIICLFLLNFSNTFAEIINLDCKIFFPDNSSIDKSWSLDTKKKNYWSKFTQNHISWVEVVLPEYNNSGKYSYIYYIVNRTDGNLLAEFSVEIDKAVQKGHSKLAIEDSLRGKCVKGSGKKLFWLNCENIPSYRYKR